MRRIISFLILVGCFIFASYGAFAGQCPSEGDVFPEITLSVPQQAGEKDYLGITATENFTIKEIKAPVVIIEIFSMYCPYCQKEAPLINELYELIQNKPVLKDKIIIIGLGAGNTQFEVDFFKSEYSIPFPLLPDESFSVHKAVGEVRTPYFFVLQIKPDGSNKIIYSKAGSIQDPRAFLELIVKKSGLEQEG
jgi:thiol-disulfide isomerase/thioredoxin